MRPETRQSIIVTAGTGTTAVISLLFSVWAGRELGREEFADFAAGVALSSLLCLALGPINSTVARFSAEYAAHGELGKVRTLSHEVTKRVSLVGIAVLAVAALTIQPVAHVLQIRSPATVAVAYALVYLTLVMSVSRGVIRGVQRYRLYNINIVFESLVRFTSGAALLAIAATASAGLMGYIIAVGATLVLARAQLREIWRGHAPQSVDGLAIRRFALPMFVLAFCAGGYLYVDVLFAKHFFNRSEAGLYGAAAALAGSISVVVTPFHVIMLPLLTGLHARGTRIAGTFARVSLYLVIIATGIILVFAIWPEWLMRRLYGAEFAGAAPYLAWITGARLLSHLAGLLTTIPVSRNDFRFLWVYFAGLVAELVVLSIWHATLRELVVGLVIVQGTTLAALGIMIFAGRPGRAAQQAAG